MAKAKKTKSGKWTVVVYTGMVDGKRKYKRITKDTKAEAELAAARVRMRHRPSSSMTLRRAYELYIEDRDTVLSASTLKEYERIARASTSPLMNKKIDEITRNDIQREVNTLSKVLSPKTVRNRYGLFTAVMSTYREDFRFKVKLPQKIKPTTYVPEDYEIEYIEKELTSRGSWLLIPFILGYEMGLRESEIAALSSEDFNRKTHQCHIHRALVSGKDGPTMKAPKSDAGDRYVPFTDKVLEMIGTGNSKARICPTSAHCISTSWRRFMETTDIQYFSFHKLRYYFCSKALLKGVPKPYVAYFLGHSGEEMVNRVYKYLFPSAIENFSHVIIDESTLLQKCNSKCNY